MVVQINFLDFFQEYHVSVKQFGASNNKSRNQKIKICIYLLSPVCNIKSYTKLDGTVSDRLLSSQQKYVVDRKTPPHIGPSAYWPIGSGPRNF